SSINHTKLVNLTSQIYLNNQFYEKKINKISFKNIKKDLMKISILTTELIIIISVI
ncbi:hypothetical protein BDDG_13171, partial [Blastomyces dermatitidis ATCC 18188]